MSNSTRQKSRRKPDIAERITPCEWCGFPITQRHHLLPVFRNGDIGPTLQICANCHEIYHTIEVERRSSTTRSKYKYNALVQTFGEDDKRLQLAEYYVKVADEKQIEHYKRIKAIREFLKNPYGSDDTK